jgi:hypothetical protein
LYINKQFLPCVAHMCTSHSRSHIHVTSTCRVLLPSGWRCSSEMLVTTYNTTGCHNTEMTVHISIAVRISDLNKIYC